MPKQIHRDDVRRMVAGGVLLVEALPREDYEEEHLPGAVNIPLKALDEQAVRSLEREASVIVYCNDHL
jgi:rhodanese-related sulfurtransferase